LFVKVGVIIRVSGRVEFFLAAIQQQKDKQTNNKPTIPKQGRKLAAARWKCRHLNIKKVYLVDKIVIMA
jgi:hypothetical protein